MFRPLLSPPNSPIDTPTYFEDLSFPVLCSPKFDGIRALPRPVPTGEWLSLNAQAEGQIETRVLSRTLKELPSRQALELLKDCRFCDGELIVGNPYDFDVYNRTQSYVMSRDKPGDLHYYAFDYTDETMAFEPFYQRLEHLRSFIDKLGNPNVHLVEHVHCETLEELLAYEGECLVLGYEGIMIRNPIGRYKHNRATYKEGIIQKLKRFHDAEAVIVGFAERMINMNEKTTDERGFAKRATNKENMIPAGMLGKFICEYQGQIIEVAPGCLNHEALINIWKERESMIGWIVKFRSFAHGVKDKPRFPRFVGFRDRMDM